MKIFHLPDLGEGLPDAEIREWHINEGDEVKVDQPIVSMETAKAVVDVPAPRSGRIIKFYGKPGDVIITGAPLLEFEDGEDAVKPKGTVVGNIEVGDTVIQESATGIKREVQQGGAIKAIPAVRALAKRLNVDLSQIKPTGAGGQITLEDVENATQKTVSAPSKTETAAVPEGYEAVRGVRRAMAMTMAQSHSEVVPVTIVDDADIHAWPKGTDITLRVVRAIIAGCKAEPALNTWFDVKSMSRKVHHEIHLGLAMDSPDGLFVPVLKDVSNTAMEDLRKTINRFKEEVKARTIPQDDLKGATIVLSNVGVFAGKYASPIIVPPTVCIIAMGRIREEAVAYEGKLEIHRIMPLSLTLDHRAVTGGEAARFLAAVIGDLQKTD
jgi:2-oxoisovalerate dehydrogenase E2 component (dihydrolipoyl transacylase)